MTGIPAETFSVTRTFEAPPQQVFDAWLRPEQFAVWFGGDAVEVPLETVSIDARTGGEWKATMELPGGAGTIHWVGEYLELDPPRRLAVTMNDRPGEQDGVPVVITFSEIPGGTEMTLTQQRGDFSDEQVQLTIAGYGSFFDSLAGVLTDDA